ncbi:Uncharacterised protein [Klebsiella pneumoniae]|nr:Uncharacterised protein [Klebsiella pneumoniae]HBX6198232.1 hypothetical protein [Klebsiella pneumoniae]
MDSSLEYACKRIVYFEQLMLADVQEIIWLAEAAFFLSKATVTGINGNELVLLEFIINIIHVK